jgi:U4/U6.U5 tri-snRNP-associated protein 1
VVKEEDDEMLGLAPASKIKLNLDYAKDFETSDYLREGEGGFKKLKKKKAKRSTRRAEEDEEEADGEPTFSRRVQEEAPQNLVDDDDLQAALARSRRANARKKPKVKAEDVVAQSESSAIVAESAADVVVAQRSTEEDAGPETNGAEDDGRITFDDTSEFVRNVSLDSLARPVKRERTSPAPVAGPSNGAAQRVVTIERGADADDDVDMSEDEDEGLAEMAAREGLSLAEYRDKIDRQMQEMSEIKAEDVSVRPNRPSYPAASDRADEQEAEEAPTVMGNGLAGVLGLLRQSGALQKRTAQDEERERVQKQKDLWMADYRARMAKRELEKIQARGGNKDQAQREWENKNREQREAREALEIYKNYKPDINIVYHDEFGRGEWGGRRRDDGCAGGAELMCRNDA